MQNQIFHFNNQKVRTETINNEPYFCASDVCKILEIKNGRDALKRVEEGDVVLTDTPTSSGVQKMSFVNEAGLYALIFQSRTEKSKDFKKWVFKEVLPSIRKTGSYNNNIAQLTEREQVLLLAKQVVSLHEEKTALQIENKTITTAINQISSQKDTYGLRDITKRLQVKETSLKQVLKQIRWIMFLEKRLTPTSYAINNNYAIEKQIKIEKINKYVPSFRITNKGLEYLIKKKEELF